LIPAKLISADNANGTATTEAVRNDLNSLVAGLKLRFPVFALVTGMEEEKGFGELMRRVGRDSAQGQRFGSRFGLWDPPVDEEISALNNHACGAFEDWAYYLFKEPASLSKPGNRDLYTLLCKIRRTLQPRLEKILVGAYSMDEQQQGGSILFAGCYFAGTGEQAERQAFVRGVFDRFQDEQEELEWTEAALGEEGRYRTWSAIAFSTTALFLIGIGVVGWQLYTRK
jgi:type VI protein secretion system component VasK